MKKRLFSFLFLLTLVVSAAAQKPAESRKFEKIDSADGCEYQRSVVDNFFIQLQNNPEFTGFIIYYEGKYVAENYNDKVKKTKYVLPRYGEANSRIQIIRDHIRLRRFDRDRILFINGGYREEFKIEFWLVPDGAELPKPTPTLDKIQYRKGKVPKPSPCPG